MTATLVRPGPDQARIAARAFGYGSGARIVAVVGGHINESYRVEARNGGILLQWINPAVFSDPDAVQDNVELIVRHLRAADPEGKWPELRRAADGRERVRTATGLWRAFGWLPDCVQYARPEAVVDAGRGAAAFARFVAVLATLDAARLRPTLSGFHDLAARLNVLDGAVVDAERPRLDAAAACLEIVAATRGSRLSQQPAGAVRVIHGDTKFSNLLFRSRGREAVAVDYDTVMPGYLAWDFGDLLRSAASSAAEDDPGGGRVDERILFACADGYLGTLRDGCDAAERDAMAAAPAGMAFMLGVRFLADHLTGDRYFRIHRPGQNLDRARHQLALAAALDQHQPALRQRLEPLDRPSP